MRVTLTHPKEREWYNDMEACYKAIKKCREIRKNPVKAKEGGVTHTMIPIEMWEALKPVIDELED